MRVFRSVPVVSYVSSVAPGRSEICWPSSEFDQQAHEQQRSWHEAITGSDSAESSCSWRQGRCILTEDDWLCERMVSLTSALPTTLIDWQVYSYCEK